jgi:hypothetical protein
VQDGRLSELSFRGIITRKEGREILERSKLYRRKAPVKAIQLTSRTSVETRMGIIEIGYPGDYLVEDPLHPDDLWIVKREVFEDEFAPVKSQKKEVETEPNRSDNMLSSSE